VTRGGQAPGTGRAAGAARLGEILGRRHLPALDGLRALAVTAVLIQHFDGPMRSFPGDLGVSFFFVLSGFLITWMLRREWLARGTVSLAQFYARRTLRIFPAYYAFLALAYLNAHFRLGDWPPGLTLSALTYTLNYYLAGNADSLGIGHLWSLAVEEQFYLLWPSLFLLLTARGPRVLLRGLGVMVCAVLVWRAALVLSGSASLEYAYVAFDTRFDNLALGCLLAVGLEGEAGRRMGAAAARFAWLPLPVLAALVVSRTSISDRYHFSVGLTVEAVLMAVLLVQMLQLHAHRAWSWLELRPLRYVGRVSYSAYLFSFLGPHSAQRLLFLPVPLRVLAGIAISVALASLMYFLVERPFLALKEPLTRRLRPGLPIAEEAGRP
jgi:peptidoglycan/LPS O-acetylase OafA/YrhL